MSGEATKKEIAFPSEVRGWLTEEEGRFLAELAEGKEVLEIGSFCGRSTVCMAQVAAVVHAVDPFDGRGTPTPDATFDEFNANVDRHGVKDRVVAHRGLSKDVVEALARSEVKVDLVFVDGAHDKQSVLTDVDVSRKVLRDDGLMAFHDYRKVPGEYDGRWDPGVTDAVDAVVSIGAEVVRRVGTVVVLRLPPADAPVLTKEMHAIRAHVRAARTAFVETAPTPSAVAEFDAAVDRILSIQAGEGLQTGVHRVGKKRVFLGVPHHGHIEPEAMEAALLFACDPMKMEMVFKHKCSSLLANCFNDLFCLCVNQWHCDYFCMLHADMGPHGEWLTQMVDELETHGLDVLHSSVAIRDGRGITSTAVGTSDPFGPVRKLTTFELHKLPNVFVLDDVMDVMGRRNLSRRSQGPWHFLPNTGCMLVRLGPWTSKFTGFTIKDRLVRMYENLVEEREDGFWIVDVNGEKVKGPFTSRKAAEDLVGSTHRCVEPSDDSEPKGPHWIAPQVASEDWNFGRWLGERGFKVGGTRTLRCDHWGRAFFPNHYAHGEWLQDEHFVNFEPLGNGQPMATVKEGA